MTVEHDVKERAIEEFLKSITSGPFRCLNSQDDSYNFSEVEDSKKVVDYGQEMAFPISTEEVDIYDCAVYQAYLDMCRTVRGAKEKAKDERGSIAKEIRCYFGSTVTALSQHHEGAPADCHKEEDGFDGWHECVIKAAQGRTNGLTVGQIQKIVNMAFKYLYCCKDIRDGKSEYFESCHMAIDAYTLKWLKRVDKNCYKKIPSDNNGDKSWSKIDDMELYRMIVVTSRSFCKVEKWPNQSGPFLAEFFIWPLEKSIMSLHEIVKNSEGLVIPHEIEQGHGDTLALINRLNEERKKIESLIIEMEDLSEGRVRRL